MQGGIRDIPEPEVFALREDSRMESALAGQGRGEALFFMASLFFLFIAFVAAVLGRKSLSAETSGKSGPERGAARPVARISCIAALVACLASVSLRVAYSGRLPFASMYEFGLLLCLALDGFLVFLAFSRADRAVLIAATLCDFVMGSIILLLFDTAHPLVPALKSAWLAAHVATAVIAYCCLAMSAALAAAALAVSREAERATSLELLVNRCVAIAFPFLTLLIITGAIWAEYAWGSFWRWDPKETWALVTWIVYLGYLHLVRTRGWKGRRAMIAAIAGFGVVLFTFFGVNLLLSGLHSY